MDFLLPVGGLLVQYGVLSRLKKWLSIIRRGTVDVLQDVSIRFPPGKNTHMAILGRSGSGKSIIGAIIVKFYDPNQGKIILDGRDIQDLNVCHLRSYIDSCEPLSGKGILSCVLSISCAPS